MHRANVEERRKVSCADSNFRYDESRPQSACAYSTHLMIISILISPPSRSRQTPLLPKSTASKQNILAMSTATHRQAPANVQTHAQQALQSYPELLVPGLEHSSQV